MAEEAWGRVSNLLPKVHLSSVYWGATRFCGTTKAGQPLTKGNIGKEVSADHKENAALHLELLQILWALEGGIGFSGTGRVIEFPCLV